jgi:N-acetylneuraminate lyase
MHTKITGLVAAPFTALNTSGAPDLAIIEKQASSLLLNGVAGAFVCGTTGEGASLSTAERMAVARRWSEVRPKGLSLIVHVGHNSLADCRALAAHAQEIRADAMGVLAPSFFKPGIGELVAFCAEVAAAAPRLPFYYYHIPSMTGAAFPMIEFLRTAKDRIPTLAGIKYTFENLMDFGQCLEFEGGRFDMLFGRDEMLLAGLIVGARGAVGSTYNYAAPLYTAIIKAAREGDLNEARRLQAKSYSLVEIMVRHGGLPAGKALMKLAGIDCGPCRLPLRSLSPGQHETMTGELEAEGLLPYFSKPA